MLSPELCQCGHQEAHRKSTFTLTEERDPLDSIRENANEEFHRNGIEVELDDLDVYQFLMQERKAATPPKAMFRMLESKTTTPQTMPTSFETTYGCRKTSNQPTWPTSLEKTYRCGKTSNRPILPTYLETSYETYGDGRTSTSPTLPTSLETSCATYGSGKTNAAVEEYLEMRRLLQRHRAPKPWCVFCKNNGEQLEWYTSHTLKDNLGRTTCPILRVYVCPRCGKTGDFAHTTSYCPRNDERIEPAVTQLLKTERKANGRRRVTKSY